MSKSQIYIIKDLMAYKTLYEVVFQKLKPR